MGSQEKYSEKIKNRIEKKSNIDILSKEDFPHLNETFIKTNQYSNDQKVSDKWECIQKNRSETNIDCSSYGVHEEQLPERPFLKNIGEELLEEKVTDNDQHLEPPLEIHFNDLTQSICPAIGNIKQTKRIVKTNSAFCIDLWKTANLINKVKKKPRLKNNITFPTRSNYSGNPLDSDRPLRKFGKYYIRNNVAQKHKKKNTKMKKIVLQYRMNKRDCKTEENNVNTSFLSKEFLDTLENQLHLLNLGSLDKQKLIIENFTSCKNQNTIWNLLRDNVSQKMRHQKSNLQGRSNQTSLDKYEKALDPHIDKTCDDIIEQIRNFQLTSKVEEPIKMNESLLAPEEPGDKIVETDNEKLQEDIVSKTCGTKRMKRLEKKMLKKLAKNNLNSDGTIVKNKVKSREDSKPKDGILDLREVVDLVVEKQDCFHLDAAKRSIHSRTFRPYCNQWPMDNLIQLSLQFVQQLVKFQDRLYKSDPIKGQSKRRYVVGFKEVKKYLPIKNRIQFLIIAPDLESVPVKGGIEDEVQNVLSMATIQSVPFVFSILRRKLGFISHKKVPVSCMGVLDYSGCEDMFQEIVSLIPKAKQLYENKLKDKEKRINTDIELSLDDLPCDKT